MTSKAKGIIVHTTKKRERASLIPKPTNTPTIYDTVIELMTAIKLSKLTPLQLNILILVSCGNGVTFRP